MDAKIITRRDFLRGAAETPMAAALGPSIPAETQANRIVADKKYHLGVSDLNGIRLPKLGWM